MLLDGRDLRELDAAWFRSQIGVVSQVRKKRRRKKNTFLRAGGLAGLLDKGLKGFRLKGLGAEEFQAVGITPFDSAPYTAHIGMVSQVRAGAGFDAGELWAGKFWEAGSGALLCAPSFLLSVSYFTLLPLHHTM